MDTNGAKITPFEKEVGMDKFVFGMNQSLDGYVDHMAFAPSPTLFRHFIEETQGQAGCVYGRQMYEVMRYWDDDHPEWDAEEHAFAAAWRSQPKWVVSRSLKSVGPNATLVEDDLAGAIRELKAERAGEIEVAGPDFCQDRQPAASGFLPLPQERVAGTRRFPHRRRSSRWHGVAARLRE